jgi:hypothetical protein
MSEVIPDKSHPMRSTSKIMLNFNCLTDMRVLKAGFSNFRNQSGEYFGINVDSQLTIAPYQMPYLKPKAVLQECANMEVC